MNEKYRNTGKPSHRLVEECGELIKAVMKAERFGYHNFHPDNAPCHSKPKEEWCDHSGQGGFMGHTCGEPKTNIEEIQDEFEDVLAAWSDFVEANHV